MTIEKPFCLSLAGFDPTAGAGVLADIKTFEMNGVYGMGIITANTLQTDYEFISVDWIKLDVLKSQLQTLMKNYDFQILKIGLVENFEVLSQLIVLAKSIKPLIKIVWDPILKSSSGFNFHAEVDLELSFLEQNCNLITPNWNEFERFWGTDPQILLNRNPKSAILIKGGHRKENKGCDLLFENGSFAEIEGKSFHGKSKHGTGCVLSSAIAAFLANKKSILESCKLGKIYVEGFILSNESNLGFHYDNK